MEHKVVMSRLRVFLFFVPLILVSSCNKFTESFSSEDLEISSNESTQESIVSELDDLTASVLESCPDAGIPGGRTELFDDRIACATVVTSDVSPDKSSGKVTITFSPNGCTDKKGNVRKGVIRVTWAGGKWFTPGASVTTTLDGYSINEVQIAGTRTVTCKSFIASNIATGAVTTVIWTVAAEHTATWPDGTTATRKINKTRKWEHSETEDKFYVTNGPASINAAEGVNRRGKAFKVYITSPLVYLGSCARTSKVFIPLKGEKVITSISSSGKTKSLTLNYGSGTCDNNYTLTSGTMVKTLTATNN